MDMQTLMQWLSLKGYGLYVWPAYGVSLLAIIIEMTRVRRRLDRALSPLGDTEPTQQEQA